MKLTERLEGKGLSLNQDVAVIVWDLDGTGAWRTTTAVVGQVHENITKNARDSGGFQDYDPECDLLVGWETSNEWFLLMFTNLDAELGWCDEFNGIKIDCISMLSPDKRVFIGHTSIFRDFATSTLHALNNRLH